MISKKLQNIFLISIMLWMAHGTEELLTGFYNVDSHVKFIFGYFATLTAIHATFLAFQIMFWLVLIISYLLIRGHKWQLFLLAIAGLGMLYELTHLYKAIEVHGYYPGLWTGLLFPVVAFFFWKELITNFKLTTNIIKMK